MVFCVCQSLCVECTLHFGKVQLGGTRRTLLLCSQRLCVVVAPSSIPSYNLVPIGICGTVWSCWPATPLRSSLARQTSIEVDSGLPPSPTPWEISSLFPIKFHWWFCHPAFVQPIQELSVSYLQQIAAIALIVLTVHLVVEFHLVAWYIVARHHLLHLQDRWPSQTVSDLVTSCFGTPEKDSTVMEPCLHCHGQHYHSPSHRDSELLHQNGAADLQGQIVRYSGLPQNYLSYQNKLQAKAKLYV